jgi:hypothetical protein
MKMSGLGGDGAASFTLAAPRADLATAGSTATEFFGLVCFEVELTIVRMMGAKHAIPEMCDMTYVPMTVREKVMRVKMHEKMVKVMPLLRFFSSATSPLLCAP